MTVTNIVPRGIRNNNPGNIRKGADWEGLSPNQSDSAFCTFTSAEYGIRAIAIILKNYEKKYGLNTIEKIINRWAPPIENATGEYVAAVAREMRIDPRSSIDVTQPSIMLSLVRAIIHHENGRQPYSEAVLSRGIAMALGK